MMLELESLAAFAAFELAKIWPVVMIGHVSLQLGEIRKLLGAHGAGLQGRKRRRIVRRQLRSRTLHLCPLISLLSPLFLLYCT